MQYCRFLRISEGVGGGRTTDLTPMNYLAVKHLHITCAALSGGLFLLRGLWMLHAPAMLQRRWIRIAPHLMEPRCCWPAR